MSKQEKQKTTLQEVKERMQTMQQAKRTELSKIRAKQEDARKQITETEQALKAATEQMDIDAYEKAKAEKRKAETALELYNGRYAQIAAQEYISEEESDAVIEELCSYIDVIDNDYRERIREHLEKLQAVNAWYATELQDCIATIKTWTSDIHANYYNPNTIYRETGSNRAPYPVEVFKTKYTGCEEYIALRTIMQSERFKNALGGIK